jgi:hypothetical protein
MRSFIIYSSGMQFGNSENAVHYAVELGRVQTAPASGMIEVQFQLTSPAAGRGVGDSHGQVREFSFALPNEAALTLARSLDFMVTEKSATKVSFSIDENALEADSQNG